MPNTSDIRAIARDHSVSPSVVASLFSRGIQEGELPDILEWRENAAMPLSHNFTEAVLGITMTERIVPSTAVLASLFVMAEKDPELMFAAIAKALDISEHRTLSCEEDVQRIWIEVLEDGPGDLLLH